jgi:cell division protein FtsB
MTPETPPPLRRRPKPAPAPRWAPRLLNYALGFVTIVLVVDALAGSRGLLETVRARRQYSELAQDLAQKRRENVRLREAIRRLREDPSAIESLAREELGLMRDGEVVFIVHDAPAPAR